jgi:ubiquinone biosynthesis monooxygenase Coq7
VRPIPGAQLPDSDMPHSERRHAAGLMRVNHTGEVCAQALYSAQALIARDPEIKQRFALAAREEEEHLAWTANRLAELSEPYITVEPAVVCGFVCDWRRGRCRRRSPQSRLCRRNGKAGGGTLTGIWKPCPPPMPGAAQLSSKCATTKPAMAQWRRRRALPICRSPVKGLMRAAAGVMKAVAYRI